MNEGSNYNGNQGMRPVQNIWDFSFKRVLPAATGSCIHAVTQSERNSLFGWLDIYNLILYIHTPTIEQ